MPAQNWPSVEHAAGALLVLAFLLFAIGATLPVVGEQGNSRIYTLPAREHVQAVASMTIT